MYMYINVNIFNYRFYRTQYNILSDLYEMLVRTMLQSKYYMALLNPLTEHIDSLDKIGNLNT